FPCSSAGSASRRLRPRRISSPRNFPAPRGKITRRHDIVIRGGTVIDGTGSERRTGDVAIDGDRITDVGTVSEGGRREIDADGMVVAPGFVDIHTHYDGQVSWDPMLTPSS